MSRSGVAAAAMAAIVVRALIVIAEEGGLLAVSQQSHADMCAQLGRSWGAEGFPLPEGADVLIAAAAGHELGFAGWDARPSLDPATGGPTSVKRMDPAEHLPIQRLAPERLAPESEYAALLVSLHHCAAYEKPHPLALVKRRHRLVNGYLREEADRQRVLAERLDCDPEVLDRDWRLVHAWDAISHALLLDRAPHEIRGVPGSDGRRVSLRLSGDGELHTLDPWPFATPELTATAAGRRLRPQPTREAMLAAMQEAPEVSLEFRLAAS
jgi:hypothetical protein